MTASQARERAKEVNTSTTNSQYAKAKETIKESVNRGEYECWVYFSLKEDVRNKLESEGYVVGLTQDDRDGSMVKVSWK